MIGDDGEREVGPRERRFDDDDADREQGAEPVDRAPRGVDEPAIAAEGARDRRAEGVDRDHEGGDEACGPEADHQLEPVVITTCCGSCLAWVVNFDGHLVIRLSRCPTRVPLAASRPVTMTSRPERKGSGTSPL